MINFNGLKRLRNPSRTLKIVTFSALLLLLAYNILQHFRSRTEVNNLIVREYHNKVQEEKFKNQQQKNDIYGISSNEGVRPFNCHS